MNSHIPFDADNDWTLDPYHCNQSNDPLVDKVIGNAYAVVRAVYCNLGNLKLLYDFLNTYGMVIGVKSEAELKKLNKLSKYARIYGYASTGDRQVTDYLYVPDDTSGIRPDDPTATGSWIKVATSETGGGGESGGKGAYIPYVYANGSALGGETSFKVPDGTIGVPFLIINGSVQYIGYGFTYSAATATVTLSNSLVQGDEVVALTTTIPANPDNPEVPGWVQVNWLYNNGSAVGGEQVITVPYNFEDVPAVYKNGLRLYKGLQSNSYVIDKDTRTITMTEILAQGDRVIVTLGGESETLTVTDRTLQEVARANDVKDSDVVFSTNTNVVITGKKIIYDVVAQKSWALPDLPPNAYIVKVEGNQLTYNPGKVTITLLSTYQQANSRELWKRSLAEAGLTLVDGSFEDGATVNNKTDAVWYASKAQAYTWGGSLPKTIPDNSTPESTGGEGSGAWRYVKDVSLRSSLSSADVTQGASLVWLEDGVTVRDAINRIDKKIFTPEDFGCDTSATDNTASINAALTSGKPVVWLESKVYKVTGRVQAAKEVYDLHMGTMVLDTSRYSLGQVKVVFADKVKESDPIRGMYVESAYDLCELAFIKGLGINTIIHYGNFNVAVDTDGSITKVADNIRALGMRMVMNTEVRDVKNPGLTLAQFIQKFNSHPAVFAWSTFDEAMSRDISYADQKAQYDAIRAYSNKPISLVDSWNSTDVISNKMLEYYDIVLADPYAWQHTGMTTAQAVQEDLKRFRKSFGTMMAHSRQKNVIPVLGLTIGNESPGSTNPAQVVSLAENFRKAGNGQFVFFVWDGLGDPGTIISAIRGNALFISCVKSTAEKKHPVPVVTEALIFGGNKVTGHQPLRNMISRVLAKDPSSTDVFSGGNAYPLHLIGGGSTNTDRTIVDTGWNVSGIGFKSTLATLVTDVPFRSNVVLYGEYNTTLANVNGTISIMGTYDGGYSVIDRGSQNTSGSSVLVEIHATTPNPNETVCIRTAAQIDSNLTRRFFKGVLISTDW